MQSQWTPVGLQQPRSDLTRAQHVAPRAHPHLTHHAAPLRPLTAAAARQRSQHDGRGAAGPPQLRRPPRRAPAQRQPAGSSVPAAGRAGVQAGSRLAVGAAAATQATRMRARRQWPPPRALPLHTGLQPGVCGACVPGQHGGSSRCGPHRLRASDAAAPCRTPRPPRPRSARPLHAPCPQAWRRVWSRTLMCTSLR